MKATRSGADRRKISIRPLIASDFDQFRPLIERFYVYAGDDIPDEGMLRALVETAISPTRNFHFLVAFLGDELVGILSLTFGESSYKVMPFAWCDDFYVDERFRSRGVGRALMAEAVEVAARKGCSSILVGVGKDEGRTRAFYFSNDFKEMGCELLTLDIVD